VDYESINENRVKHLEMIQAVIGRLGNDSFLVKGWSITVAGAFFGFAVSSDNGPLALAAVLPTGFFWSLDTYYLWSERLFRVLYDHVRTGETGVEPFFMAATSKKFIAAAQRRNAGDIPSKWEIFRSTTLRRFYLAIIATCVALLAMLCAT
jgi:hypothetical protein